MSKKYHLINVNLTKGQILKARSALKNGLHLTLRIGSTNMGHGDSHISLTQHQVEVLMKKVENGLGAQVKMSHEALKHTQKHGAGFGDMLRIGAKKLAAGAIRAGAGALADWVGSGIKKKRVSRGKGTKRKTKTKSKSKVRGGSIWGWLGSKALHGAGDLLSYSGLGIKKRKIATKKRRIKFASGIYGVGKH